MNEGNGLVSDISAGLLGTAITTIGGGYLIMRWNRKKLFDLCLSIEKDKIKEIEKINNTFSDIVFMERKPDEWRGVNNFSMPSNFPLMELQTHYSRCALILPEDAKKFMRTFLVFIEEIQDSRTIVYNAIDRKEWVKVRNIYFNLLGKWAQVVYLAGRFGRIRQYSNASNLEMDNCNDKISINFDMNKAWMDASKRHGYTILPEDEADNLFMRITTRLSCIM